MISLEKRETLPGFAYLILILLTIGIFCLCICVGSVNIPLRDVASLLANLFGRESTSTYGPILLQVRIPRVLCVGLVGASLSMAGAAMQGLLKNPLADGSTLGVSAGASLGAVLAIVLELSFTSLPFNGTTIMAIVFAFLSLLCIMGLAYRLDCTLSTNTIILIGVVFSMFASSLLNILIAWKPEKVQQITFWTMGSLQGASYADASVLGVSLLLCGGILLTQCQELNAFAIGEENANAIGVHVKRTKLLVLITVSILIGVCVSIGGTIAFVGLVTPHIIRMISGPNHKKLLPLTLFLGADFLLLADLVARTVFSPKELPIGVVTSLVGAITFVWIFYRSRKGHSKC